MRCSPTVKVDRLKPFFERAGTAPAPGPVSDVGLNRRLVRGVTRYLVRWRGHTSADDEWLRAEELTHCQEKVAEYVATPPTPPRGPPGRSCGGSGCGAARPSGPGTSAPRVTRWFPARSSSEGLAGTALVGQAVLYRWPVDGWVRGTVAARSRAAGFSHVVRNGRTCALGSVVVHSLLDAASHGPAGRWVLLRRVAH